MNVYRLGLCGLLGMGAAALGFGQSGFRPPAVPLLTSDPYFSVWSEADRATDDVTRHWTKHPHPLVSLIRVDGTCYRILGNSPAKMPAMTQTGLTVTATKTTYTFASQKVEVQMSFLTPCLPTELDVYARPVTYLRWEVKSADGATHKVQIYDGTSGLLSVEDKGVPVDCRGEAAGDLTLLRAGAHNPTVLRPMGDDTRINWGYVYAAAKSKESHSAIGTDAELTGAFAVSGMVITGDFVRSGTGEAGYATLPGLSYPIAGATSREERSMPAEDATLAFTFDLGTVGAEVASAQVMIGYDEIYSIDYYGEKLRPYWRRKGATPEELFETCEREYPAIAKRSEAFDAELSADAESLGGPEYAAIVATAYRECVAANGLAADAGGNPLLFTKENTSNGDIATVDVIFPMDPIWVLLSPTLAKASLVSNFQYAASPHWKFPNAPHDLGTYPRVFGRDDGGEGMPVEESGNMILLTDAIAHDERSPEFANQFWPQLTTWAKYLEKYGLDPEDQLCTDDFMGHLAHNANLSVKAILALAAYGDLCKMRGEASQAAYYGKLAKTDAAHWVKVADAGDHSLLAFDKPNTWSQKYNLVWDQILGLHVFPASVRSRETAYYVRQLNQFGVPLDSRTHLTKTDWSIWSATCASDRPDFEKLVDPIYAYLNGTTARDPIADSYETDEIHSGGMHARPVVGGFFVKFLDDPAIWRKWESRDHSRKIVWSPLPVAPKVTQVVPDGRTGKPVWHYTTARPPDKWNQVGFDDSAWSSGPAGFGSTGTPAVAIGTQWTSDDIWLRRKVTLPQQDLGGLVLTVFHDEDVEVYIDGVLATSEPSFITDYESMEISPAARALLRPGATVMMAVHCHQTTGGQGIDVGFGRIAGR